VKLIATETTLDAALAWREMGVATIPLHERSKKAALPWARWQRRLPSEAQIKTWFAPGRRHEHANLGVVCGWEGLTVLDFDDLTAYARWQTWTATQGEFLRLLARDTYKVATSRGVHVYVAVDEPVSNLRLEGLDVKAGGGYVLAPPSVHPNGRRYVAMTGRMVYRVRTLAELLPGEWLRAVPPPPARTTHHTEQVDPWSAAEAASRGNGASVVQAIREKVSILEFFPEAEKTGAGWYVALCPFHDDHNPSFWIKAEEGYCGCYAGCTAKPMDVINLYARLNGLTNGEAIEELRGRV